MLSSGVADRAPAGQGHVNSSCRGVLNRQAAIYRAQLLMHRRWLVALAIHYELLEPYVIALMGFISMPSTRDAAIRGYSEKAKGLLRKTNDITEVGQREI